MGQRGRGKGKTNYWTDVPYIARARVSVGREEGVGAKYDLGPAIIWPLAQAYFFITGFLSGVLVE